MSDVDDAEMMLFIPFTNDVNIKTITIMADGNARQKKVGCEDKQMNVFVEIGITLMSHHRFADIFPSLVSHMIRTIAR